MSNEVVNAPVPGPNSTKISQRSKGIRWMIFFAKKRELGVIDPIWLPRRKKWAINRLDLKKLLIIDPLIPSNNTANVALKRSVAKWG